MPEKLTEQARYKYLHFEFLGVEEKEEKCTVWVCRYGWRVRRLESVLGDSVLGFSDRPWVPAQYGG